MNERTEEWEKEFDLEFRNRYFFPTEQNADKVKDFIRDLKTQAVRETVEKIKSLSGNYIKKVQQKSKIAPMYLGVEEVYWDVPDWVLEEMLASLTSLEK